MNALWTRTPILIVALIAALLLTGCPAPTPATPATPTVMPATPTPTAVPTTPAPDRVD